MELVKRKIGRPLKIGARKKRMVFSCNDEERKTIKQAARLNNMSISEYIRTRIYNDSIDCIDRRKSALSEMYGTDKDEYYDDFGYEDEPEDENCI